MSAVDVEDYKKLTLELLSARQACGNDLPDETENDYTERLDVLWYRLTEDEIEHVRAWVAETVSDRPES